MNTPEFLYRGTPRRDVAMFTPKEIVNGRLVVSASPSNIVALKFVVPTEGLKVCLGSIGDYHYYLCADEKRFRELDTGGAVYALSPDGFEPVSEIVSDVWINPNPVTPISKEEIPSSFNAMIKAGIQVYFVSDEILVKFKSFPADRLDILKSLVSENTK